jgi:hypothetical protein
MVFMDYKIAIRYCLEKINIFNEACDSECIGQKVGYVPGAAPFLAPSTGLLLT